MSVRQTIYDLCAVAEMSKVPVLIMSNPGYAKSTCIESYAKDMGYYLETLVGSRYEATDISGYLVNEPGSIGMVHKEPSWYRRIIEAHNRGQKTMLFIDELSTCPHSVQGTLLTLIFNRTIGENKFLPEDTVIMSAANYANNLNDNFDIIPPTLNRFCVFNLIENISDLDLLDEFLSDKYKTAVIRKEIKDADKFDEKAFKHEFHKQMKMLLKKYSNMDSSLGLIDLHNTDLQDLYRKYDDKVLNQMSGRSVSYVPEMLSAVVKLGIKDKNLINGISDGLIGAGSCSFKQDSQLESYRNEIHNICCNLCFSIKTESGDIKIEGKLNEEVNKFLSEYESNSMSAEFLENYKIALVNKICEKCEDTPKVFKFLRDEADEEEKMSFINFMEMITNLISKLKDENMEKKICGIHQSLLPLYNDLTGTDFKIKDFNNVYGFYTPKFCEEVILSDFGNDEIKKLAKYTSLEILMENDEMPTNANLGNLLSKNSSEHKEVHLSRL